MKKLPIGISTLRDILDGGFAYVDKTAHVLELLNASKYYFLSRPRRFAELIRKAKAKYDQGAVVLIDEYDKPILDNITEQDIAAEMRNGLRNFYSVIKDSDQHVRFAFLTGVCKFSKVSIFSGLNNLEDITLDERYSTLCGYTQYELEDVFAEYMEGVGS